MFDEAKNKILRHIQSGYDNEIISKPEFEAMCPESKKASKLYCNFKIHKEHDHIPPVRAIISGSGSILENPSKFVDFHLKDLADKHESYIQDTPDFIRKIEELNNKTSFPQNALLVTLDVTNCSFHKHTTSRRNTKLRKSPQQKRKTTCSHRIYCQDV